MVMMMMGAAAVEKEWFLALIQSNQTELNYISSYPNINPHTVYSFCEKGQPLTCRCPAFGLGVWTCSTPTLNPAAAGQTEVYEKRL